MNNQEQLFGRVLHEGDYSFALKRDDGAAILLKQAPWLSKERTDTTIMDPLWVCPVDPRNLLCVGRSYAAHAKELGNDVSKAPLFFLKATSSLIGVNQPVIIPQESERVDFEGELALVIGKELRRVNEEAAANGIFGYTQLNDVTARDIQRQDVQFTRGKSFDSFCPVGPFVVSEVEPPFQLRTFVNDDLRQDASTNELLWSPAKLVSLASQFMTLYPGDVLSTGTPSGVGPLKDGDVVKVVINDWAPLTNPVSTENL